MHFLLGLLLFAIVWRINPFLAIIGLVLMVCLPFIGVHTFR